MVHALTVMELAALGRKTSLKLMGLNGDVNRRGVSVALRFRIIHG